MLPDTTTGAGQPSTGGIMGAMVRVECHAGYKAEERPLRFFADGREFAVTRVVSRWRSPDEEGFRVETALGTWDLRHELASGTWTAKPCAPTS